MFEMRSTGTTHNDHDNRAGWDSHQQQADLTAAQQVMARWTGAFYDYTEQFLKAQRQFAHSLLGAGAPLRDVAQDVTSSDAKERTSGPRTTRSDQHHERSTESWKNERSNDDTAKYNKRVDSDISGDSTSDTSRTERATTHTDESAKTPGRGAASTAPKLP
jgi:hypothetical protein